MQAIRRGYVLRDQTVGAGSRRRVVSSELREARASFDMEVWVTEISALAAAEPAAGHGSGSGRSVGRRLGVHHDGRVMVKNVSEDIVDILKVKSGV